MRGHCCKVFIPLIIACVAHPVWAGVEPTICPCPGDVDGSGTIDGLDIQGFADCMLGVAGPGIDCVCADMNGVGGIDVVDIQLFIAAILAKTPCPPPLQKCCFANEACFDIDASTCINVFGGTPFPGSCAPLEACCFSDGTCQDLDPECCLNAGGTPGGPGTDCATDTDGDRIPDTFETNDCVFVSVCATGTDPLNADTDGDGIEDGDEVYGTLAGLDLPAMGAHPCRKDLFIETDWVQASGLPVNKNRPHANQVARLVTAFANAPVLNPNGTTGIQLHIDYGQGGAFTGGNSVVDPSGNDTVNTNLSSLNNEFNTIKSGNFAANRNGYFHYCIMCDKYSIGGVYQNSSGLAELPGDDFMVSMGQWATGNDNFIGNTIMHELGHNLKLRHGGDENRNFKPNYNSIMNYWYQFCGTDIDDDVIPDDALDYSRDNNIDLNESSLNEPAGVTGSGPAINWNNDGDSTDVGLSRNINCRLTNTYANSNCGVHSQQTSPCGTTGQCYDSTCNLLHDFDDWTAIELNHLDEADFAAPEIMHCWLGDDQ